MVRMRAFEIERTAEGFAIKAEDRSRLPHIVKVTASYVGDGGDVEEAIDGAMRSVNGLLDRELERVPA